MHAWIGISILSMPIPIRSFADALPSLAYDGAPTGLFQS